MSRLYLITPPVFDPAAFADKLAEALDAGDVACVQLRLKGVDDDTIRRAADVLRLVAQSRDVAFLMNDRADLALATGCDGVHIGQPDDTYQAARQMLGLGRIVGVTCHASRDLAIDAAEAGADYVAFGAFFPTGTKTVEHHADIDLIRWWSEMMTVPCVAIGGITPENCRPLIDAGADFLAMISSVWDHPGGPGAAVKAFQRVMAGELSRQLRRCAQSHRLTSFAETYIFLYMSDISYTEFRRRLAEYMDKVWKDRAPLRVSRQNARAVVVLSEAEYEGMIETLHLLRSPANTERLLRSIKHAESGKMKERETAEPLIRAK